MSGRTTMEVSYEGQTPLAYRFFFDACEETFWVPKSVVDDSYTQDDDTADIATWWLEKEGILDE